MDVESLALAPPLEQALRQVMPCNRLRGAGLPRGLPGGVEAVLSSIYPLHHWGSGAWHRGTADTCGPGNLVCGGLCGRFSLAFCSFTLGGTKSQERKVGVKHPPSLVFCRAGP